MTTKRVGYYCWAGPGTIRMIKTKYFDSKINVDSLMSSYEKAYIGKVKELFGTTDFWATYSWGYSTEKEKHDHEFLIDRIGNFKSSEVNLHAYLQGTNLVSSDFDQDYWARDNFGRTIPYFRGRLVTCVNNPYFVELFTKRLDDILTNPFDGIYIDNVQMGQMTILNNNDPLTFFGCNCKYCKNKFAEKYSTDIPSSINVDKSLLNKYMQFRSDCMYEFIENASQKVRSKGKQFGTNSYDPKFNSNLTYGFDILRLSKLQDYLLFEHHSFSEKHTSNSLYINKIAQDLDIPVFSLAYKKGIGREPEYTQNDVESLLSEAKDSAFSAALKGSEFTTDGVWHNLDPNKYTTPRLARIKFDVNEASTSSKFSSLAKILPQKLIDYFYGIFNRLVMQHRLFRPLMSYLYKVVIR